MPVIGVVPRACAVALAAAAAVVPLAASAQKYPSKSIRIVLPVTPGGGTDIIARLVGQKLSGVVNQQVVIDNRGGAGGNIAAEIVAKSPPDGYTLIVVTASHATNPFLYKKMNYDPVKDFAPVTQLTSQPYIFIVHPSVPVKSVKEFIALSKKRKGGLSYASSGAGLLGHLGMELLKTLGQFEGQHIPYKGAGPAMTDVLGGQVEAFFPTMISGLPHVKNGKVRAIGITSAKRSTLLPDVPTIAEQGFPGYEVSGWYGFLAPTGTPKEVIDLLNHEVVKILALPDVKERMAGDGADPVGNTSAEFNAYILSEMKKWQKVIKDAGATAE